MGFLKNICDKQQNAKYRNLDTFGFFWVITMKKAKTKKQQRGLFHRHLHLRGMRWEWQWLKKLINKDRYEILKWANNFTGHRGQLNQAANTNLTYSDLWGWQLFYQTVSNSAKSYQLSRWKHQIVTKWSVSLSTHIHVIIFSGQLTHLTFEESSVPLRGTGE